MTPDPMHAPPWNGAPHAPAYGFIHPHAAAPETPRATARRWVAFARGVVQEFLMSPAERAQREAIESRHRATHERERVLDPNTGSNTKIEKYSCGMETTIKLGEPGPVVMFMNPCTLIRGQRVIMNAPMEGFVMLTQLKVANVDVLVGGREDAYAYSTQGRVFLDVPTVEPANRFTVLGEYTGRIPASLGVLEATSEHFDAEERYDRIDAVTEERRVKKGRKFVTKLVTVTPEHITKTILAPERHVSRHRVVVDPRFPLFVFTAALQGPATLAG